MNYTIEQIVELAKEVEREDLINWDNIHVDQDKIYQLIGSQVYDLYHNAQESEDAEAVMLATITKLVVENFILNVKLEGR